MSQTALATHLSKKPQRTVGYAFHCVLTHSQTLADHVAVVHFLHSKGVSVASIDKVPLPLVSKDGECDPLWTVPLLHVYCGYGFMCPS